MYGMYSMVSTVCIKSLKVDLGPVGVLWVSSGCRVGVLWNEVSKQASIV